MGKLECRFYSMCLGEHNQKKDPFIWRALPLHLQRLESDQQQSLHLHAQQDHFSHRNPLHMGLVR